MTAPSASPSDCLPIGGVTGFSSVDWPGHLCATVFVSGCPWKCGYCHNSGLKNADPDLKWSNVQQLLIKRRGFLDGVVFSGGEPTQYKEIGLAAREAHDMGFSVGLHTSGCNPENFEPLLKSSNVEWVGLDFKAPLAHYEEMTGRAGSAASFAASLHILKNSGVRFEVRTTVASSIADPGSLERMGIELAGMGVRDWTLQQCRTGEPLGGYVSTPPLSDLKEWAGAVSALTGLKVTVRGE
ncbi:MAG: anaerobic ribonucleoside-triphosphate reductase activating protein [Candidatus Brocadiia bacterium]